MRRLRPTAVLLTAVTTITIAFTVFTAVGARPGTAEPSIQLGNVRATSARQGALPAATEVAIARSVVRKRAARASWAAYNTPAAKRARVHKRKIAAAKRQAAARRARAAAIAAAARAKAAADARAAAAAAAAAATATTAPPVAAPTVAGAPAGWHSGMCGGNLPTCCIMMRESGGNPAAYNPSGAAGKWQFMPGTWGGYGGFASAAQAPEWVQDARAIEIWAGGAGAGHWAGDGC